MMVSFQVCLLISISFIAGQCACDGSADEVLFYQNYYEKYGGDHLIVSDEGKEVSLLIDQHTGSGFTSNQNFGSGDFHINLKIPNKSSSGIITTFYLMSQSVDEPNSGIPHDEVDFEFLGGNDKYTLSTNVFASDGGHREQQFNLWFDPTTGFHSYRILWNQYNIVFFVDDVPIRIFKNNTDRGVNFPSNPMHIEATIWNDTNWVGEVDWSQGSFTAYYRNFSINGCQYQESNLQDCYSNNYYWNPITTLSPEQYLKYEDLRGNMTYDYCHYNATDFPECMLNN
ncbi:hypothetical protein CQW23_10030 [Capsicum baccatum]|uniref:GH16 domain-containing protein n=1 Tax=Capsicum baccatum TaxID=33114 RepID=A0A2G2WYI2_CAPBA|nr:hypothetical protein CQW23_10030 [Capsicum baccatum]